MKNKITSFPWHAFLAAVFPALFFYRKNFYQLELPVILKTAFICLLVSSMFFMILRWRRLPAVKSGLLITLSVFFFFSYGAFFEIWSNGVIGPLSLFLNVTGREEFTYYAKLVSHFLLLAAAWGIYVCLFIRILRSSKSLDVWNAALNFSVFCLIILNLFPIGYDAWTLGPKKAGVAEIPSFPPQAAGTKTQYPDIYYIILDGFCRDDMMRKYYEVRDSGFIDTLEHDGFYVAKESRSNYSETILSLPSSLNMKYLDGDERTLAAGTRDDRVYAGMIQNNFVMRYLKSKGYLTVHFGSVWSATMSNPFADMQVVYRKGFFRDEFNRAFFGMTMLLAAESFFSRDVAETHLYNFEMLAKIPRVHSPKFVFAHFLLPHSPYVFGRMGNIRERVPAHAIWHEDTNLYNDAPAYRNQAIAASRFACAAIRDILKNSKTPPVILLQADHGINLITDGPERIAIRHAILNAYYFPDGDYSRLYPGISPVNSFRVLFNKYFDGHFKLLEDTITYTFG